MPVYMKIDGMAEISETLEKLDKQAPGVAAQALYVGAGIMQKAILKAMESVKTAPFKYAKGGEQRLPSPEEKEILYEAGVGIAKFDKNGLEMDTSVGFNQSGYADVNWNHMSGKARTNYKAKSFKKHDSNSTSFLKAAGKYERGLQNRKPIGVVANAINSGTSFMKKQPFIRNGVKNGTEPAMAAMKAKIEEAFEQIIKEK